jgi:hypothetical protein
MAYYLISFSLEGEGVGINATDEISIRESACRGYFAAAWASYWGRVDDFDTHLFNINIIPLVRVVPPVRKIGRFFCRFGCHITQQY